MMKNIKEKYGVLLEKLRPEDLTESTIQNTDLAKVIPNLLERWYEFGRIDWVSELEYPEWTVKEVGRFLNFSLISD